MRSVLKRCRRAAAGFTLLEVMIALAILGMSLTTISQSQQNSIRAANRAKWMSVAVMLARYKMVEVEDTLFEEGFSDFEESEEGDFDEEGFEKFSYVLTIDKIELPATVDTSAIQSAMGDAADDAEERKEEGLAAAPGGGALGAMGGMASLGAGLLAKQFEMIRNVLEQSIRRVQLKVTWPEGSQTREVTVVGYFTDPRVIDAAVSGRLTPAGVVGADGTTTGTTTGTTPSTTTTPRTTTTPSTSGGTR